MNARVLAGPIGTAFLRDAHAAGRSVFAWTVNDERWMEWCARGGGPDPWRHPAPLVEGVVSDNPERFLAVCERIEEELDGRGKHQGDGAGDGDGDGDASTAAVVVSRRQGGVSSVGESVEVLVGYVEAFLLYLKRRYIFGHFDDPIVAA
jgi:hypothetical protein